MKAFLISVSTALVCVCLVATTASAQESHIRIFADTDGTDCRPQDLVPNVFQVHVVQIRVAGSQAAEFTVTTGGGFDGVFLGEVLSRQDAVQVGNAESGTAIGLGICLAGPVHFLTLRYFCEGKSARCSYFEVSEYVRDNYRGLNYVDCDLNMVAAAGGRTYINGGQDCPCDIPGFTTPVEESTWGGVKALYR
ncbi:MAG: hypothetical protein ACE5EO_08995 [Candidatus Krumholzibacteriia bacterium]